MIWPIIHIIDYALWFFMAASVAYCVFFALASLFRTLKKTEYPTSPQHTFLVLFPAYNEDKVIVDSIHQFLKQDYSTTLYEVVVISDNMSDATNQKLGEYPITLLTPDFEKSSKAKALQYAISIIKEKGERRDESGIANPLQHPTPNTQHLTFDYVVVLDADNIVNPDFLLRLNQLCNAGYEAIQCHRCAKNANNGVAVLDGASEEINNSLFRLAHNNLGLSSALIGSGMCFRYDWFASNVFHLQTAGEDRELEALLMKQNVYIKYAKDIHVLDEKVTSHDNFQRQRLRWMTAQVQSLTNMLPYIPKAILSGNINFIDKTIQQALIPRSMLLVGLCFFALLMSVVVPVWSIKWWILLICLVISLIIALPSSMRTHTLLSHTVALPGLVWRMLMNLLHIDRKNTDFLHTTHEEN